MAEDASKENQQFEEVLSRLDALMHRTHAGGATAPLPTDAPAPQEVAEDAETAAPPSPEADRPPFFVLEEIAELPVLTDVYEGPLRTASPVGDDNEASVEEVIDALMPRMLENLDLIVAEEAARMQQTIADRLRFEIGEALRQRLQEKN